LFIFYVAAEAALEDFEPLLLPTFYHSDIHKSHYCCLLETNLFLSKLNMRRSPDVQPAELAASSTREAFILCDLCQSIDLRKIVTDTLTEKPGYWKSVYEFGAVKDLPERANQTKCTFCSVVWTVFSCHFPAADPRLSDEKLHIRLMAGKSVFATTQRSPPMLNDIVHFSVVSGARLQDDEMTGEPRHQQQLKAFQDHFGCRGSCGREQELENISRQFQECVQSHANCQNLLGSSQPVPLYLIDTRNMCIIEANSSVPYLTLSYVWGGVSQLRLSEANLTFLKSQGALGKLWGKMPRVIREAIRLTSALDIISKPYLWVDSLCIVHDNSHHLTSQVQQMDVIYASSQLTIVAHSAKDANGPLLRHGQGRDIHGFTQHLDLLRDELGLVLQTKDRIPDPYGDLHYPGPPPSVIDTRAWTFQEQMLSTRLLSLNSRGPKYLCGGGSIDTAASYNLRNPIDRFNPSAQNNPDQDFQAWLGLSMYTSLVEMYHGRVLTLVSDKLRAFTGIMAAVSKVTCAIDDFSTFVSGIPWSNATAACLAWVRFVNPGSEASNSSINANPLIPCYSWAGCNGLVVFPFFDFTRFSFANAHPQPGFRGHLETDHDFQLIRTIEFSSCMVMTEQTDESAIQNVKLSQSNTEHHSDLGTGDFFALHVHARLTPWTWFTNCFKLLRSETIEAKYLRFWAMPDISLAKDERFGCLDIYVQQEQPSPDSQTGRVGLLIPDNKTELPEKECIDYFLISLYRTKCKDFGESLPKERNVKVFLWVEYSTKRNVYTRLGVLILNAPYDEMCISKSVTQGVFIA
jgi:hypothetical protein